MLQLPEAAKQEEKQKQPVVRVRESISPPAAAGDHTSHVKTHHELS